MVSIATAMMASELGSGGCGQAASAIGACFLMNLYNGGDSGNRDHKCPSQGMEAQRSPFPGDSLFLFETEIMWDTKPPCQPLLDFCPFRDSAQTAITTVLEQRHGLWDTPLTHEYQWSHLGLDPRKAEELSPVWSRGL